MVSVVGLDISIRMVRLFVLCSTLGCFKCCFAELILLKLVPYEAMDQASSDSSKIAMPLEIPKLTFDIVSMISSHF